MILDKYLIEIAKSANDESYGVVSHNAVGTDILTIDATDTSLPGEIGTRGALTGSRSNAGLQFSYLRTTADVVGTSGDDIKGIALFDASTAGNMYSEYSISGLLQTTNFDVEFVHNITFVRV